MRTYNSANQFNPY